MSALLTLRDDAAAPAAEERGQSGTLRDDAAAPAAEERGR